MSAGPLPETVEDVLRRKVGIEPTAAVHPRLLRVFDDPDRDDRTWAISVAHSVSMRESDLANAQGDLVRVNRDGRLEDEGPLLFDHDQIVATAVEALRERYEFRYRYVDIHPDPDGFLPSRSRCTNSARSMRPSSAPSCTRTTSTAA